MSNSGSRRVLRSRIARFGLLFLVSFASFLVLAASSCRPMRAQREESKALRTLTPMQRFRFTQHLSYMIWMREDVIAAKVSLHVDHDQADYVIVRLIPDPERYTAKSEKDIRLYIYHQTYVAPPFVKVVRVREL